MHRTRAVPSISILPDELVGLIADAFRHRTPVAFLRLVSTCKRYRSLFQGEVAELRGLEEDAKVVCARLGYSTHRRLRAVMTHACSIRLEKEHVTRICRLIERDYRTMFERTTRFDARIDSESLQTLSTSVRRAGTPLCELCLDYSRLGDEVLIRCLDDGWLFRLTTLSLAGNHLTSAFVRDATRDDRVFPVLEHLWLQGNLLKDEGARAACRPKSFPRLHRLGLAYNRLTDEGMIALSEAIGDFRHLTHLALGDAGVSGVGWNRVRSRASPLCRIVQAV